MVDDNANACRMMVRLVKSCGHDTACVTSGEEALEYLGQNRVDLVILDNMMPGMNGIEVLLRIRLDPRTTDLPVVMWSAIGDAAFIEQARGKGATDYWLKAAFDYAAVCPMVDRVLRHPRPPRPEVPPA